MQPPTFMDASQHPTAIFNNHLQLPNITYATQPTPTIVNTSPQLMVTIATPPQPLVRVTNAQQQ